MQRPHSGQPMMQGQYRPQYAQQPQRPPNMVPVRAPGQMMPHHPQQGQQQQQYAQQHLPQHPQQHHMAQQHHPQAHMRHAGHHQRATGGAPTNQMPANAARMSEQETLMREQQARNRAERPTDLTLPDGVDEIAIGDSGVQYRKLREFEQRLDATMMRKDREYQDRLKQRQPKVKKMRIWVSNTAENQPWQGGQLDPDSFDFKSDLLGTFRMKITGKLHQEDDDLLDDEEEDEETDQGVEGEDGTEKLQPKPSRTKLSHFFEKIVVEFDRSKDIQPEGITAVEWTKPAGFLPSDPNKPDQAEFDTLEFERKSDENINCTIHLYRDQRFGNGDDSDQLYSLSDELTWILGKDEATRGDVIEAILEYAKAEGLQQDDEKRIVQCDEHLRAIFNTNTIAFPTLPAIISSDQFVHMQPLKPISIPYTIRVDQEYQSNPVHTIYDVLVPAEDLLHERLLAVREQNPDWAPDLLTIKELDRQLALVVQKMQLSKARHSFYRSMERDPVTFIKKWVSSQMRDLDIIMGDSLTEIGWTADLQKDSPPVLRQNYCLPGDEFRRGGADSVWRTQSVRESVALMLSKGKRIKAE